MSSFRNSPKFVPSASRFVFPFVLGLILLYQPASAISAQVTVAWNASGDADIAGYRVYYGTSSNQYTSYFNAGSATSYTLSNLQGGTTYYIASTAYDTEGFESDFSEEVAYQTPGECVYTPSPASQSFDPSGASATVTVNTQSGCTWTATSNASWIVITSNPAMTGGGDLNYTVLGNEEPSQRIGTMTVAGQTVTISQAGVSDSSTLSEIVRLRFDEGTGQVAADGSGNGNNGTISGAVYTSKSAVGSYALTFNGYDDYVSLSGNGSLETLKSSDFSVSLWVKHTKSTSSVYGGILKGPYGDGYSNGFRIVDYMNKPLLQINFGDGDPLTVSGKSFSRKAWTHVVITYDHQNINLYQNGALFATVPETRNIRWSDNDPGLYIGLAQWYFKGSVDDVRIFNYALTSSQAQAIKGEGQNRIRNAKR